MIFCFKHDYEVMGKTYLEPRVAIPDQPMSIDLFNEHAKNPLITGCTEYLLKCKKCQITFIKRLLGRPV